MAGEEAPLPVDRQWETRYGDHYFRFSSLFSRKHGSGLACNPRPRWSGGSRITGCCRPDWDRGGREHLSGVEFMDYVHAGQVIRLGPHQTIVLSYMASCVRETITGGTVTVGTQRSEVQSGHVRRIEGHCYSGRMELTGEEAHVGGRVFRGPAH